MNKQDFIPNTQASQFACFYAGVGGGIEAGGHGGSYDPLADMKNFDYLLEEEEQKHGGPLSSLQYEEVVKLHERRVELNKLFWNAEVSRTPETMTEYVWKEDEEGIPRLYHEGAQQFMHNMFERTARYAQEQDKPGLYNDAEVQSFYAIERSLRMGTSTGGLIAVSHESKTVRYMTHISATDRGIEVRYVDVGTGYRDLKQEEADRVLSRIENSLGTATRHEETKYPYLLFHGESPSSKTIVKTAIYTAYIDDIARKKQEPEILPVLHIYDDRFIESNLLHEAYKEEYLPVLENREPQKMFDMREEKTHQPGKEHREDGVRRVPEQYSRGKYNDGISLTTLMIAEWLYSREKEKKAANQGETADKPSIVDRLRSFVGIGGGDISAQRDDINVTDTPSMVSDHQVMTPNEISVQLAEVIPLARIAITGAIRSKEDMPSGGGGEQVGDIDVQELSESVFIQKHPLVDRLIHLMIDRKFQTSWDKVKVFLTRVTSPSEKPNSSINANKTEIVEKPKSFKPLSLTDQEQRALFSGLFEIRALFLPDKREIRVSANTDISKGKNERQVMCEQIMSVVDFIILFMLWHMINTSAIHTIQQEQKESKKAEEKNETHAFENHQNEESPWLLLAIIYYLVMIREQGKVISKVKKQKTKIKVKNKKLNKKIIRSNTFGNRGVIYAYSS